MSLDFDCVIMNPPYDGNTHLKILNNVVEEFPDAEIVNLSPIRWLQDPLAEYKKASDFKRFPKIRERIEDLDEMGSVEAEQLFGAAFSMDLGIYKLSKNGKGYQLKENKLLIKMVNRMTDNVKDHIVIDDLSGICLRVRKLTWGSGRTKEDVLRIGFNLPKELAFWTDKTNDITGETFAQYRAKHTNRGSERDDIENVKFATKEERQNYYDSWNTKTLRWMFGAITTDMAVRHKFLPWLGDYTKKWDDAALREYFELTDEEWKEIEGTVK